MKLESLEHFITRYLGTNVDDNEVEKD